MTVIEELAQTKTELTAKTASLTEAETTIKAGVALIAQASKERDDIKAAMVSLETKHAEDVKKINDTMLVEQTAHIATKAELDKAQKALANPAFASAAVKGDSQVVAEGGTAKENVTMTKEQAKAAHDKITDPKEQACFRRDHAVELGLV